jgi:hypothetical protein
MAVEWKEPPNVQGAQTKWRAILSELDARPGEWAIIARDVPASTSNQLKKGYTDYEFTLRGVKGSRASELYGRRKV